MLCTFDGIDSVVGVQRENQAGEQTITRSIPNEYGTINQKLQFDYGLIKRCSSDPITYEEQQAIERWLTSPKFSKNLYVIDDDDNITATYCGKFINTNWYPDNIGFIGVSFTFENNTAYPKKYYDLLFTAEDIEDANNQFEVNCVTDELEEYCYPVITITNPNATANVTITNVTDNNNAVTIKAYRQLPITMDSRHCILKDATTSGVISFDRIGWSDVGNIYWPRLIPGSNVFTVSQPVNVRVTYEGVYKKVGGWL